MMSKKKKNQSPRREFITGALNSLFIWLPVGFTIAFLWANERVMIEPIHQSVTVLFSQQAYLFGIAMISLVVIGIYLWLIRTSRLYILGIVALVPLVITCWMIWTVLSPRIRVVDSLIQGDTQYLAVLTHPVGNGWFHLYECEQQACTTYEIAYQDSSSFEDASIQFGVSNQVIIAEVEFDWKNEVCEFTLETQAVQCYPAN